ncbi:MAG: pyruvate carboxylase [Planctomycetota bacterium]|nr:MAG: pyruvate carboxylase [Planctomycetota bacterium]
MTSRFRKLMAANRSEIAIRVFRSAHELGIRTVAIYSHEDRYALHRFKADESYPVGRPGEPIQAYLDIEGIIRTALKHGVEAIHPGYGFLSENPEFAQACREAGIVFVGPPPEILRQLGDKLAARQIAERAGVPVLGGSSAPVRDAHRGRKLAAKLDFPVILKAAHGGGGRGMRVVRSADEFDNAFEQARRESLTAFGSPEIFIEKFIERARHIEVQLLGDAHGNLVHLFERDCSVQRRHQKVVEIAPAFNLDPDIRQALCEAALKIGRAVNYCNAGTVEFLLDVDTNEFYFIEVNPRIQVEHTVTEQVTGVDIVKSQILIAEGRPLDDRDIDLGAQQNIQTYGYAIQCRVTTEDPGNRFMPDYGRITHYRSASGMGIRLDAGTAFSGAVVHPFYDSLLVKVTAWARHFPDAARRMERCLQEFRIRGVKTNIPFLVKLILHPTFLAGRCTTRFIDETPELFDFPAPRDRASRLLRYLAETIVNGNPLVQGRPRAERRRPAPLPNIRVLLGHDKPQQDADADEQLSTTALWARAALEELKHPAGTRDRFRELGAERFAQWVREQRPLLLTDTTFRDAHQSLFATRFRTFDLLQIADAYAHLCPQLFSLEMWGGATFDTAMRFLKESPWQRLSDLRERIPNILFQMLLRASNAVGYTNYPDNVVRAFVREAAQAGIDVFRVFDALNWVPNMRVAMEAVQKAGAICEAAICYTGDILDPSRTKYTLNYYVDMAKQLEKMGAHILAIKDMAGLCKPYAAAKLVRALKDEIGIPIHFHTHDTAGIQAAAIVKAAEQDLDIADGAMAPMSGGTSQPNLNTLVEALRFTDRDTRLPAEHLDAIAEYWRAAREFYTPFESPVLPAGADLYRHQMPGGQYTNLYQQARALGLADRWSEVCRMYAECNELLGDIVKVTPTSKAVGDLALFLIANDMTPQDILHGDREIAFPQSVVDLVAGRMGQNPGGFPRRVRERILRGEKPVRGRPGASLPPADFDKARQEIQPLLGREPDHRDVLSYLLYPQVFRDFAAHQQSYGDTSVLPTPAFFYGLEPNEEIAVDIEEGKTLIIRLLSVGEPHEDGRRTVFFELNGQPREVTVIDRSLEPEKPRRPKADPANPCHVAATMPGMVVNVAIQPGEAVVKGQKLVMLEAMKMQTIIAAERDGRIQEVLVRPGMQVETGDLLVVYEPESGGAA